MKIFWMTLLAGFTVVSLGGCGKKGKDRQPHGYPQEVPQYNEPESFNGELELVPDEIGVGGTVSYKIDKDGKLVYNGYVTYCSNFLMQYATNVCGFLTQKFEGTYAADPKTFMSRTYTRSRAFHNDFRLAMRVDDDHNYDERHVNIKVLDQPDVEASFTIDTSARLIRIKSAVVHGLVFNHPVTITVRDAN